MSVSEIRDAEKKQALEEINYLALKLNYLVNPKLYAYTITIARFRRFLFRCGDDEERIMYGSLSKSDQRNLISRVIDYMLDVHEIREVDRCFELTQSGTVHAHGTIDVDSEEQAMSFQEYIFDTFKLRNQNAYHDVILMRPVDVQNLRGWREYCHKQQHVLLQERLP